MVHSFGSSWHLDKIICSVIAVDDDKIVAYDVIVSVRKLPSLLSWLTPFSHPSLWGKIVPPSNYSRPPPFPLPQLNKHTFLFFRNAATSFSVPPSVPSNSLSVPLTLLKQLETKTLQNKSF